MPADDASIDPKRNTERMNFRTKPHIKRAIQRAAALSGVDDSSFTLNAAYQAALDVIERHERTVLAPEDLEVFFTALDNPSAPNQKLRAALGQYNKTIVRR